MTLKPEQVFTPSELPLHSGNVYSPRQVEADIRLLFGQQRVPLIYGDYGVGKTSTIKKVAAEDPAWKEFYFEAGDSKDFGDFFTAFLEEEGYEVQKKSSEVSREGGFTLLQAITAKIVGKEKVESQLLVSSPTDRGMLALINQTERLFIIDELHKASDAFRQSVADFIKSKVNHQLRNVRIALVGTVHDPASLIDLNEGIDRTVLDVRVEPMTDDEAAYIVTEGMKNCGLLIDKVVADRIVRLAGGAPSIVHDICLYSATTALDFGRQTVTTVEVDAALEKLQKGRFSRYSRQYKQAIEKQGTTRWRTQIMKAMALIPDEIVATEELTKKLSEILGRPVVSSDYTFQMQELQELKIIAKVEIKEKKAGRALWRFAEPAFKNFLKFQVQLGTE